MSKNISMPFFLFLPQVGNFKPFELSDSEIKSTYTMLEVIVPANMIIDIQRDVNSQMEERTYNL